MSEDIFASERASSLYLKLETWTIRQTKSRPAYAPVCLQLVNSLADAKARLDGKMHLTGRAAVVAICEAMRDDYTLDAAPLTYLARKYGHDTIHDMFCDLV